MLSLPQPSIPTRSSSPGTTLFRFLGAVGDHWWLFTGIWILVLLLSWLAWTMVPTRYTATSSVLIPTKTTDPIAGIALPGGLLSNHLTTQLEIMQSERVALRALRVLQPEEDAAWRRRWEQATGRNGVYESWAAEQLLRQASVNNARDSNVLVVAYKDSDPQRAARIANGLVQAYLETSVELRLQPARQYSAFFDERVRRAKETLNEGQARLVEFQQRHGLHSLDERADVEEKRLAELGLQVTLLETRIAGTRGRLGEGAAAANQEAARDPFVIEARIELARQEARLAELEERLGNGHPQWIQQQQVLAQRRAGLATALSRAGQSIGLSGKAEAAQLSMLKAAYEQQQAKVLDRKKLRDEGLRMQKNVEDLQRSYETVLARYQTTTLESEDTQPNVSILKVATPPARPSNPGLQWFMSGGALLGFVLALSAVFVREWRDARLRHGDHIMEVLQKPFLVQLPYRGAVREPATESLPNPQLREAAHETR